MFHHHLGKSFKTSMWGGGEGGDLLGLLPPIKAYRLDLIATLHHPNPF